jgi:hypothetical protein
MTDSKLKSFIVGDISDDGVDKMQIGDKTISIKNGAVTINGRLQKDDPNESDLQMMARQLASLKGAVGFTVRIMGIPVQIDGDDVFVNDRRQVDA